MIVEFANGGLGSVMGTDRIANDFPLMPLTYAGVTGQATYPDLVGNMNRFGDEGSPFNRTVPLVLKDFAHAVREG